MKNGALLFCVAIATTLLASTARGDVLPSLEVEGDWIADPSRPLQCIRAGSNVECIMVNAWFAHKAVGKYITPTLVQLEVTRRNRTNNCTTSMTAYLVLISNNRAQVTWLANDSNCDLTAGQSGVDPEYRRIY